jgi:hypothetical protein
VDDCLNNTLLRIDEAGRVTVNLDTTVRLLIRESDCLVKMDVELPIVCHSLYAKKHYFTLVNDSLEVSLFVLYATFLKLCDVEDRFFNTLLKIEHEAGKAVFTFLCHVVL